MNILSLDGAWKVKEAPLACKGIAGLAKVLGSRAGWMRAKVPGEIHLDLLRAGRLEEPLVSLNAKKSRWPEHRSWWFGRTFEASEAVPAHERQQLVFDGMDLYAQVFLNGEFLGETRNAFVPHVFDVRRILKRKNRLVVRLTAGEELVDKSLRPKGSKRKSRQSFPGISHLRKPQFTYGWDWVDALPNIGIWRGVRIEAHSGITLHDVTCSTRICREAVSLDVSVVVENLHPWSERRGELKLSITPPEGKTIRRTVNLRARVGRSAASFRVEIPDPKLWWPNGMGDQPLYRVAVHALHDGEVCDCREMDIGLRTIELDRSENAGAGSRFCIKVNGQDVFCKGGNWIPADAIIARVNKAKYDALVAEAKNANLNMFRVWGGGVYESPDFYGACDRAGILVWQDFMFACAQYPDHEPEFRNAVRAEAESVVRSLRHHPSIALWCGNNENVWGFADWWNAGKDVRDKDLRVGGTVLYNQILPDVCRALDPDRPYWPSSPCGGESPNSERDGDCHWWPQGTMNPDMNRRIDPEVYDECVSPFVSEYGVIGYCRLESVREYLKPEEVNTDSRAWKEHTNTFEKNTIPAAIERHYADVAGLGLEARILYGQMFQATMYGLSLEALRFRKHDGRYDCQGALIWMYDDCWGETGWTPIDYYLRRKPSYYWIRNACAPVKAIVRRRGSHLAVRVVNDTLKPCEVEVHYGWFRTDGTDSRVSSRPLALTPNSMVEVARERVRGCSPWAPLECVYAAWLMGEGFETVPSIWKPAAHRQLRIFRPNLRVAVKGRGIELLSDVYCHGVHYPDGGRQMFSDNYFDLLPGIPKTIECVAPGIPKKLHFCALL